MQAINLAGTRDRSSQPVDDAHAIDPAYSAERPFPEPPPQRWLYPEGEYEAFVLARMRADVKALKLLVGYPGNFPPPSPCAFFRRAYRLGEPFSFSASGEASTAFEGAPCEVRRELGGALTLTPTGDGTVVISVVSADVSAAAPGIASPLDDWEAGVSTDAFSPAVRGGEPTGPVFPRIPVPCRKIAPDLYDFGRELLADLVFNSTDKPVFTAGESRYEAEHVAPENQEQTFDLVADGEGLWRTPLPLAFRFVRIPGGSATPPVAEALFTPVAYRGDFTADDQLTRIWMASAYTLRLCLHTFQIDGIKRDRLPWAGDFAISLLSNAYTFADPEPVRRTFTVLGRGGWRRGHVNGILDYTLWIVICHDLYQRFFGDLPFLRRNYADALSYIDGFLARSEADGGLIRHKANGEWLFIDWLSIPKTTALEMLSHWALHAAASLARRMGESGRAARYEAAAAAHRERVVAAAWDEAAGLFRGAWEDPSSAPTRHANFLAILSGLADANQTRRISDALADDTLPPCGTPYMISLELLALHRAGRDADALARIRKVWGGMLNLGATTFFEGYRDDFDEATMCAFYDRPFGMSLCHAWSSAPAFLLPMIVFGAEPRADGFRDIHLHDPLVPGARLTLPAHKVS